MENQIKLDVILKFLVNSEYTKKIKKENDNINLKYLDYCNSSKFNFFKDILFNHVDRIGIHHNNKLENSIYFSLLYILYKDYYLLDNNDQNSMIKTLKNRIKDDIINRNLKLPKDLFKKKAIQKLKKNINNEDMDVYILSIFFNINIYVFSYSDKKIKIFYKENELNTYKKNIFINEINNIYYPLIYKLDNGRFFKYNSTLLNNILFSNYVKIYNLKNNKEFVISNNWESILDDYLKINTSNIIIDIDDSIIKNMQETDSESDLDYENLTDEIEYLNEKMNSNSENLNLESSDEENLIISQDDDEKIKLVNELKNYSDSKLKSLKKDDLLEYLKKFVNLIDKFKKEPKSKIILNLRNEINKFI